MSLDWRTLVPRKNPGRLDSNSSMRMAIFGLPLLFLTIQSGALNAQELPARRMAIGIQTSFAAIGNSSLDESSTHHDAAAAYEINFTSLLTPHLSVRLGLDSFESDFKVSVDNRSERFGSLKRRGISVTGFLREDTLVKHLRLYAGGGLGYYDVKVQSTKKNDNEVEDFFALNLIVEDTRPSFEVHGNLGLEYALRKNYALSMDLRMSFSNTDVTIQQADGTLTEADHPITVFIMGFGLRYYFR